MADLGFDIAEQFMLENLLSQEGHLKGGPSHGPPPPFFHGPPPFFHGPPPFFHGHHHGRKGGQWGPRRCGPGSCGKPDFGGRCGARKLFKAFDVYETDDAWILATDYVKDESSYVKVEVDRNTLTVSGEEALAQLPTGARVVRQERRSRKGSFSRAFEVPEGVDHSGIRAKVEHGELRIVLPKRKSVVVTVPVHGSDDEELPDAPPAQADAGGPSEEKKAAEAEGGWVDVTTVAEKKSDDKGKQPMDPEARAEVERQLKEMDVASDDDE